jgi:predicted nucleotidyltransferase
MDKKKYSIKEVKKRVRSYASYLEKTHRLPVEGVYLFGSYAKKKAHTWSDIDVCIVSPHFSKGDALSFLWTRRRKEDILNMIAPIGIAQKDFDSPNPSPLVYEIKKTGVKIK